MAWWMDVDNVVDLNPFAFSRFWNLNLLRERGKGEEECFDSRLPSHEYLCYQALHLSTVFIDAK